MMNYNKVFYVKRNGKVVACKFKSLHFWFGAMIYNQPNPSFNNRKNTSYTLILADGTEEHGYHEYLPTMAESIDDCLNGIWIDRQAELTDEICEKALGFVPDKVQVINQIGPNYMNYMAWMWDGYKAVYKPIGSMDGGACRSNAWYNALTQTFEMRKHYKTEKECVDDNTIKAITFDGEVDLQPQMKNYSVRVFASRTFEVQAKSSEDAEQMAKQMLQNAPLGDSDIDEWCAV